MEQHQSDEQQPRDDGRLVRRTIVTEEYIEVERAQPTQPARDTHDLGRVAHDERREQPEGLGEVRQPSRRRC